MSEAASAKHATVLSTLNGLRGLAAVCVMIYHRRQWMGSGYPLPDAFLAVDFFFLLSGFVISRAYEDRLRSKMTFRNFAARRVQRLLPLIVVGVCLAALIEAVKAHSAHSGLPTTFGLTLAASLFTLPSLWLPLCWPLDPPIWSLFFEVFINIVFGLAVTKLNGRSLKIAVGLFAITFMAFSAQIYSDRPDATAHFAWGFPRVTLLFYLGVLIEKFHSKGIWSKLKIGLVPGSVMLLLSFAVPNSWEFAVVGKLAVVMILYPIIIIGGANIEPRGIVLRAAKFSGDLSYPLYILHIPLLGVLAAASMFLGLPQQPTSALQVTLRFLFVVVLASIALKFYDEPVRNLIGRWVGRSRSTLAVSDPSTRS